MINLPKILFLIGWCFQAKIFFKMEIRKKKLVCLKVPLNILKCYSWCCWLISQRNYFWWVDTFKFQPPLYFLLSKILIPRHFWRLPHCLRILAMCHIFWIRDHPYSTSANGLGGWGQKKWLFLLTFRTIYADVGECS